MIKKIIKYLFVSYWLLANLYACYEFNYFACGKFVLSDVITMVVYNLIFTAPGAYFILRSFNDELYKRAFTYVVYFVLMVFPVISIIAVGGILGGCATSF